ncbi:MAG: hypothetical protein NZV14_04720 [Bryobacteraceae bacterium]|nr:hypothetical protein [Bryobacteraceae bacterium]MDW8377437.1 hypothetical protein [Bryobacterales bacterium]
MKPSARSWLAEVEQLSGHRVVVVPVETNRATNTISIPADFPGRPVVRELLMQENFVAQFVRAYALTVSASQSGQRFHFVLLNLARAEQWQDHREQLLAHEAGHLWLDALGYRSLQVDPSDPQACLATHASDIVQHILIRQEMQRRGFDSSFWIFNQQEWLRQLPESGPVNVAGCERAQVVSLWLDGALGLNPSVWPQWPIWKVRTRQAFPDLVAAAERLASFLENLNLWDRSLYEAALGRVFRQLQLLG